MLGVKACFGKPRTVGMSVTMTVDGIHLSLAMISCHDEILYPLSFLQNIFVIRCVGDIKSSSCDNHSTFFRLSKDFIQLKG